MRNKILIIQEFAIDGAVAKPDPEVIGRVCLHSNTTRCHFMCSFILTGQFDHSFW